MPTPHPARPSTLWTAASWLITAGMVAAQIMGRL